jgi:serine/threonine protein kinase
METGIHQSARALNTSGNSSSKLSGTGSSFRKAPLKLSAISGKREFIEINALGAGASGVVVEAIHIPSLTIVALKMLPVYNKEKRKHVSRELEVLYKNLTELRLVDDSLYSDHHDDNSSNNNRPIPSCRNIVSLYNAFIDPTSGLINLVIEYMDGGSLEDLVKQGGCTDERILADIAYQTCKGLSFLHDNKHVHRDIKPANILCSTSGHIKIADFGVARALDNNSNFAHSFIGTVCYMSP